MKRIILVLAIFVILALAAMHSRPGGAGHLRQRRWQQQVDLIPTRSKRGCGHR